MSKSFTIAGHTFRPSITTTPAIRSNTLAFTSAAIDGAAGAGGGVASALEKIFGVTIDFGSIPFHIKVRQLALGKDGLVLALAGADLTYDKSG